MSLSCAVPKINCDFSGKSQILPTPVYFVSPLKGFSLELAPTLGIKKLEWWGYRTEKEVWR